MKLIRELHDTIKEDSKLIIFCDNKILYDQAKNTYSFAIKDLNLSDQLGPYLAIALIDNCFVYVLNIDEDQNILGLFMDPDVIHFVELRQMLGILDQSSFLLLSRATILESWLSANVFCSICGNHNSFNKKESAVEC